MFIFSHESQDQNYGKNFFLQLRCQYKCEVPKFQLKHPCLPPWLEHASEEFGKFSH